jgi:hypothetical protein
MVFSNFEQNVYFKSYKYWILWFSKYIYKKIYSKTCFHLLVHVLREERENSWILMVKRKNYY